MRHSAGWRERVARREMTGALSGTGLKGCGDISTWGTAGDRVRGYPWLWAAIAPGSFPRTEDFMGKQDDKFTFEAVVTEALPNAMFKVQLPNEQRSEVLAYVSGKMRMNYIRILPGDRVTVEISPYDLTKARITFRH